MTEESSKGDVCTSIQCHCEGLEDAHGGLLLSILSHIHVGIWRAQQSWCGLWDVDINLDRCCSCGTVAVGGGAHCLAE